MDREKAPATPADIRYETAPDGRRALVVPGRFRFSWEPAVVDRLDPERKQWFEYGVRVAERHMRAELDPDPRVQARAAYDRTSDGGSFVLALNTAGATLEFPDRNVRYHMSTTLIGSSYPYIGEPLDPSQPMAQIDQEANCGLPNPWNVPEWTY